MRFLIFLGTVRQGRYSEPVAEFVLQTAQQTYPDHEFELIDPRKLPLSWQDEGMEVELPQLRQKVEQSDGFVAVFPEYNHSFPGSLKYLLDLNLKAYIHKPISFVGVSSGAFGGTRAIESLVNVVRELGLVATFTDVNFSFVQKEFDNYQIQDPDKWARRIKRMLTELLWMAQTLKYGRENL